MKVDVKILGKCFLFLTGSHYIYNNCKIFQKLLQLTKPGTE